MLQHLNKHILSEHPTQIEQTAAYRKKFDKIIEAEEEYHDYINEVTDDNDDSESDHMKEHVDTEHTSEKEKTIQKAIKLLKSKDFRSVEYDDPVEYTCENCSKVIKGQTNLIAHNLQYHYENPEFEKLTLFEVGFEDKFPCRVCLKTFSRKSDLKAHVLRIHCNERRYVCKICGNRFKESTHLQKHLFSHAGKNQNYVIT